MFWIKNVDHEKIEKIDNNWCLDWGELNTNWVSENLADNFPGIKLENCGN